MSRPTAEQWVRRGVLTPAYLAVALGVAPTTIRRMCSKGILPHWKAGNDVRMEADLILPILIERGHILPNSIPTLLARAVENCRIRRENDAIPVEKRLPCIEAPPIVPRSVVVSRSMHDDNPDSTMLTLSELGVKQPELLPIPAQPPHIAGSFT